LPEQAAVAPDVAAGDPEMTHSMEEGMGRSPLTRLHDALMEQAGSMLRGFPHVPPFGATLQNDGRVALATADGEDLEGAISTLATMFRSCALAGDIKAAALCWLSAYKDGAGRKRTGVFTHCETVDGSSRLSITPFSRTWLGKYRLGRTEIRAKGHVEIFDAELMKELRSCGTWPVIAVDDADKNGRTEDGASERR
jgi:hypothetical protein